jgi:AraC-like DNA-binding protein
MSAEIRGVGRLAQVRDDPGVDIFGRGSSVVLGEGGNVVVMLRAPASAGLLVRLGLERGVPAPVCLRTTGLRVDDLIKPEQQVTADQELAIISNLLEALNDPPGLGLEAGLRYHLTTFGIWGFALISSATLRGAVRTGLRHRDLTYTYARLTTHEDDDEFHVFLDVSTTDVALQRFLVERDMTAIHVIQRELFAAATHLDRVSFAFPKPTTGLRRYQEVFGFFPEFDAPAHSMAFDRSLLDVPLPQAESYTADVAEAQCQLLLEQRRPRGGMSGHVWDVLYTRPCRPPTLVAVAAMLHLSPRVLRRRRAEEGVSYRVLLDGVRQKLAEELLIHGRLTVEEIAQRLGYAETSSFTHAFRRWNGVGPRAFRRSAGIR